MVRVGKNAAVVGLRAVNEELARRLLESFEDRKARLGRAPTRPSVRVEEQQEPVAAVAVELAKAISEEWPENLRPSERVELRKNLEAAVGRLLGVV